MRIEAFTRCLRQDCDLQATSGMRTDGNEMSLSLKVVKRQVDGKFNIFFCKKKSKQHYKIETT